MTRDGSRKAPQLGDVDDGAGAKTTAASRLLHLFGGQRLSPSHRLIAHYLVENPHDALFLSSNELAERVGVSQPSVTRFAIALGFSGYADLKEQLRDLILEGQDEVQSTNKYRRAISAEVRNLEALAAEIGDGDALALVGEELMNSEPLLVFGSRASEAIARYFSYFARKIHRDVRLVVSTGGDALDRIAQARDAGASVLLGFQLPRYPLEAHTVISYAHDLGIRSFIVTDTFEAPSSRLAEQCLVASVGTELVFDSQAAPMLLGSMLFEAMCDARPADTRRRLEAFEQHAGELGLFASAERSPR